jgi:hypothetical protein
VRIANYEDGVTSRHDATRVLEPFIASIVGGATPPRRHLLTDTDSLNKVARRCWRWCGGHRARAARRFGLLLGG